MSSMKRWQLWLGLAISAIFLYLALRGLGLKELGKAFTTANYWWLIPGVIVYFIGVWVRSWRWHYLLRPVKDIPTVKLLYEIARTRLLSRTACRVKLPAARENPAHT